MDGREGMEEEKKTKERRLTVDGSVKEAGLRRQTGTERPGMKGTSFLSVALWR